MRALLILPVLTNIGGFWRGRLQALAGHWCRHKTAEAGNSHRYGSVVLLLLSGRGYTAFVACLGNHLRAGSCPGLHLTGRLIITGC
jgi:hypothetical protein